MSACKVIQAYSELYVDSRKPWYILLTSRISLAALMTHNLKKNFASSEALSGLLLPGSNAALGHGGTHGRHGELGQCISPGTR